jgi:hypothetical protein
MEKIDIIEDNIRDVKVLKETECQVTIHISFTNYTSQVTWLRIWKSTYLFTKECSKKSQLLHFYNIAFYPKYTFVQGGQTIQFTLIFSALPKSCKRFNLVEQIPEPGGFVFNNIVRNSTDVYYLTL